MVLLLGVTLLALGFFLNRVGLPEPVKRRLIAELRQHGWEVQFSRLRLRWHRGIVAEDLQLQRTNRLAGPQVFIEEAECPLQYAALWNFELVPTAVQIKNGRVCLPVRGADQRRCFVDVRALNGRLRFQPDDTWELHALRGTYHQLQLELSGTLTNASGLRDWTFARPPPTAPGARVNWLDRLEATARQVTVLGRPELEVVVHGDARTFQNFHAGAVLRAPGFASPWGHGTNVLLSASFSTARTTNDHPQAEVRLDAAQARTPWAAVERMALHARFAPSGTEWVPIRADVAVQSAAAEMPWGRAAQVQLHLQCRPGATNGGMRHTDFQLTATAPVSEWGSATNARVTGQVVHSPTNWLPQTLTATASLDRCDTPWGNAAAVRLETQAAVQSTNRLLRTGLAWSDRLADVGFTMAGNLTNVARRTLRAESAVVALRWRAPELHLDTSLVQDGHVDAQADLNLASRHLTFAASGNASVANVATIWGSNAPPWLSEIECRERPRFRAAGQAMLPSWTNGPPNWRAAVLPTVAASARLELGESTFRGLEVRSLTGTLTCTNSQLVVRPLEVVRPEGELVAELRYDLAARTLAGHVRSQVDPHIVAPFFHHPKARQVFEIVQFAEPPYWEIEAQGPVEDWKRWHGRGQFAVTNFTVRGEYARTAMTRLHYTNQFLSLLQPRLERAGERATADGLGFDLRQAWLHLTNATGNFNPYALLRAINPRVARILERYHFGVISNITGNGVIGLRAHDDAENVHFRVAGRTFRWQRFQVPEISGDLHIKGKTYWLTNVVAQFYGGRMAGHAWFDNAVTNATELMFYLTLADGDLRALMADVSSTTNRLEGRLSGVLNITRANTADPGSWQGQGQLQLLDGLIWDIPVFGIVSRMLNTFAPGLGNSRAKEGTAIFHIINSVICTTDLDIHATGMRVHLDGTVGFDGNLDARIEAELLRDLPAFGIVVSKLFWPVTKLFVLKVTGTWNEPVAEPLYVIPNLMTKIILLPFRPLSTLKDVFSPAPPKPGAY